MKRIHLIRTAALLALILASAAGAQDSTQHVRRETPWASLFDGETLNGWTQRNGTATYRVEGGTIVGKTTNGSPNSFLCSDRDYSDFELKFEVRVDDNLNSGVQIRSRTRDGFRGRVNGPQVEIEASGGGGAEAGYLYAEAAGGWMTPADIRKPHKHFTDGEWNAYRVLAAGPRIQVWVNGVQISDLTHEGMYGSHPRGFIGLQVHGIGLGAGPFEVSWRNIELREIRDTRAGWVQLYNGKDLTGWKTTGNWIPQENGELLIQPRPGEQGWQRYTDYLWSEKKYKDFILDVEYAYPPKGNSGVYFRVGDTADPVAKGIEAQILDCTGKEGAMSAHDHGGIISAVGASKNMSLPPGEWNRMIVTARGKHLEVGLNGLKIIDLKLDETPVKDRPLEGYIGLQDHGEPHNLRFRNIWLKELGVEGS
jgi:opacity protein-like surface antigen